MLQWEQRSPSIAKSRSRPLSPPGATGGTQRILQPRPPRGTASGTATKPAAGSSATSPGRGEGKGLVVPGTQG